MRRYLTYYIMIETRVKVSSCATVGRTMATSDNRLKLLAAIRNVIVSLEENILALKSIKFFDNGDFLVISFTRLVG
jgi:hypothetical protein